MMNKKKSILLTFILLIVGGLSTLAAENVAKIGTTEYATLADAVTAANANDEVVIIKEGTYTIPGLPKNITIKANEGVNVKFDCEGSGSIASIPNGATFEGVTMNFGQSSYHGFQHAGTINMNSCTLNGLFFSYGDMNFNGCTFNQTTGEYMMWCYAGDLTYTNCEFNGKGKFLNIYNEGNGSWKISVAGCKFNSDTKNKAALNIKETCGATLLPFEVTIGEDNELEGNFPANSTSESLIVGGDGLWQVDGRYSNHTKSLVVVKDSQGNILYEAEKPAPVAKIDDVEYATLADAVAAVPTDGTETTITMIGDDSYTGTNPIEIASGKTIILDLNGKTISYVSDNNASDAFITNKGKLTIIDKTEEGKITAQQKTDWNNGSYTINNYSGNLVINGGTIENTSDTGLAWPLNNGVYGSTADMVINGGTIYSTNYVPVREYLMFGGTKTITINGGTFVSDNSRAIAVQFTEASVAETNSYVKVNGGTFNCKGSGIFYFDLHANNVNTTGFTFEVTAGSFTNANTESPVVAVDNEGRDQSSAVLPQKFISGGTFSKAPDAKYVAEGYEVVEQDNAFIVQKKQVAKIGETTYSSLEEAIAAVKDGETITMIANEVLTKGQTITLENNEQFTLDLNGKTISIAETGFDFTANGTNVALRNGVPARFAIVVNGNGTLNICDNSTEKLGKIETKNYAYSTTKTILVDGNAIVNVNSGTIAADYAPFYVVGFTGVTAVPEDAPKPTLNVNGGKIVGQQIGIGIKGNTATLKVVGGEIVGNEYYGVSTNGTQDWYDGGKFAIEITGGLIKSVNGNAMYLPAEGPTVITGGTIEGTTGIAVKGGSLSISNDAVIKATGPYAEAKEVSSGNANTGSAVYVEDTYSDHAPIVNISGGKFSSVNNKAVEYYTTKAVDAPDKGKITVYAGLYDDDSAKDYLAEGKTVIENPDEETQTDYPYAVVPLADKVQVAPDLEITSVDEESPLTPTEQTAAEEAVKSAIEDMAENTEVTNLPKNTKTNNNNAVESDVVDTEKGQSVGINVEFTGTKVSVETGTTTAVTLKELTFDVTPYVVETITIGSEEKSVAVKKIENQDIKAPMTFRLPIPSSVTDNYARVIHYVGETNTEDMGLKEIKSTTDQTEQGKTYKYIEITTTSFSKFEAILKTVNEPSILYYYAGNDTKVEVTDATPSAFQSVQETCKNAIAIVSSEYAEFAKANTNVLIESDNDANGKSYVCPKFVLTDLEDFYTPVDFVAETGSYTRTADNVKGMNSVCLPFAITKAKVNNGKIGTYKSSNIEDGTGTISFEEVNSVDAGVPCIVECTGGVAWEITFNNTEIKATIDDSNPIKGAYIKKELGAGFFKVSSDGTKFVNTVAGTSHAWPFRAYLDLTKQESAKELTIEWNEGSTTGIEEVQSSRSKVQGSVYNLNGMRVNPSTGSGQANKGIVIMNGKKYIK